MTTRTRQGAFTLLELLAAVTLLVVLGTMLFQIFGQAARVTQIGTGRQEVFQYARSVLTGIEHELIGAITQRDKSQDLITSGQSKPAFHVFHTPAAIQAFNTMLNSQVPSRPGTDALTITAAIIGRDTVLNSPTYGQVGNNAWLAYWVNPNDNPVAHEPWALNRYECYDISSNTFYGAGWEVAVNVLEFQVQCLDQFHTPPLFASMDWDPVASDTPTGERRGLPLAVTVVLKLTDSSHVNCYQFDAANNVSALKSDKTPDDDPVVQQFRHVVRLRETLE